MAKGRGKAPSALRAFPSGKTRHQSIFPFFSIVQPCTDTKAQPQICVGYNQRSHTMDSSIEQITQQALAILIHKEKCYLFRLVSSGFFVVISL